MGSEAICNVRYGAQVSEGKALLESAEVLFRGEFRLKMLFTQITSVESGDGELRLGYAGDVAVFELGLDADKWAERIRNPRGLLDKLGVKRGMNVVVLGVADEDFLAQLVERVGEAGASLATADADIVFYEADRFDDLGRLSELRSAIKPPGTVWVVSPKGRGIEVKDTDVMAAARKAGLVDNKVVSFSQTHTALRLVIPKSQRRRS